MAAFSMKLLGCFTAKLHEYQHMHCSKLAYNHMLSYKDPHQGMLLKILQCHKHEDSTHA